MDTQKYLTQKKYDELATELQELKTVKRKEVAQNLEYARALGDLSENTEYHEAREAQAMIEDRIAVIENALKTSEIVHEVHGDSVTMGSEVSVEKTGSKGSIKFKIVGSDEANADDGKISNVSPLGSQLLGKKKGDSVTVKTPKGSSVYKIVSVA